MKHLFMGENFVPQISKENDNFGVVAGIYDSSDKLLMKWKSLINEGFISVDSDNKFKFLKRVSVSTRKIVIPYGITNLPARGFEKYCNTIRQIVIPDTVVEIENASLSETNLEALYVPKSVMIISGSQPLFGCKSVQSIVVDTKNPVFDSRDDCNAIIKTDINLLIAGCKNTIIPNTVKKIGSGAFKSVQFESIDIPSSVETLGEFVFEGCSKLKYVHLPDSISAIPAGVFRNCTSLEEIVIPNSVTDIYSVYGSTRPFSNCPNLKTIHYSGTATGAPWGAENATVVP